ncbi:hypothetical protein [Vibrio sp. 10N.222.51.C5]|uniref:GT-D fold domain-containing protein n=1 Tax=Vibrio sp. 10N.222.51.C5 TaxID=3229623 RepID=UPI00355328C2
MNLLILGNELSAEEALSMIPLKGTKFDSVVDLANKKYICQSGPVKFNNLIELIEGIESLGTQYEYIVVSGGVLNFASEINIRTALSGLMGRVTNKLIYIDRLARFKAKSSELSRVLYAINFYPDLSEIKEKDYSFLEFKKKGNWFEFEREQTLHKISEKSISTNHLLDKLEFAIQHATSFSFVRINHCENRLLGYGLTFSKEEANITYDIQFGYELCEDETNYISSRIKDAVRNSDVLGVPIPKEISTNKLHLLENTTSVHFMRNSLLREQSFMNVNTHYHLGENIRFKDVLNQADKVIAITCRNIDLLSDQLNKPIDVISIPSEHRHSNNMYSKNHFPDRFYEIERELEIKVTSKTVVLIGAGILAKVYCDIVKSNGGIAIDVGSLMDAVENVSSRGDGFGRFNFWWK